MQRRLTITMNDQVYEGLHRLIGRRKISQFIESLIRPHVMEKDLEAAYQRMAEDEAREAEALAWSEALIGDISDEGTTRLGVTNLCHLFETHLTCAH